MHRRVDTRCTVSAACQAKRSSRTTSYSEGMLAFVLGLGRLSRSERAKDLPALHTRMELHAPFTRFCIKSGTDSAFAFARLRRKWAVSTDHRPPVSAASTTRRARPSSPANSGYVVSFLRRFLQSPGASRGSPPWSPRRRGDTSVVPQRQPVCDHLNPSSIEAVENSQIEVAHEGVWGHSCSCLPAHFIKKTTKESKAQSVK